MPASQLRCEAYVPPEGDVTGENVSVVQLLFPAQIGVIRPGAKEHAVLCPRCGKPVCDGCADEHGCVREEKPQAA